MTRISTNMNYKVVFANKTVLAVAFVAGIGLMGCSKCEECKLNGNTETLCETEFDSPDQFQDAIADRESAGAVCTSSGGF